MIELAYGEMVDDKGEAGCLILVFGQIRYGI